ncbi:MAG: amidohydrolase [Acidimicrobiia bacterium]|nr:amidohydrolase [Acidimicrobiia bacterium]
MPRYTADQIRTTNGEQPTDLTVEEGVVAVENHREDAEHLTGAIVAGLRDAHFHPITYAASLVVPSLKSARSFSEIGDRLNAAALGLPVGQPISAIRLDDQILAEGRLPTRSDLDAMTGDRPVIIHRYCGHIAVANSAALQLAGVTGATPDPSGGTLDRDDHGEPTGVLREMGIESVSLTLAERTGPAVTDDQVVDAMLALASVGLTSIGGIVGCGDGPWADLGDQFAQMLRVADRLPINVRTLVIGTTAEQLREAFRQIEERGAPRLSFLGVKIFGDGSLGGHTAAMHEPFSDADTTGQLRFDPVASRPLAETALELGGIVAIHAIGDRANAAVLDFYGQLVAAGADPARLRIEHASVLGREEIEAFAELGVVASVQPAFMASETGWLEKRIGHERMQLTYPLRTLRDRGVPLAGGSDCPVEPPHPLWGIAAARDRCGIVPEQGLTPQEALDLFTADAARSMLEPEPLAVGSPADFVVLDVDPISASPDELRDAEVIATYVDGVPVDTESVDRVWRS